MISRRSLFALFGGAAVAPMVKVLPVEARPVEYYDGHDVVGDFPYVVFRANDTSVGTISARGGTTFYNTSSDKRLMGD